MNIELDLDETPNPKYGIIGLGEEFRKDLGFELSRMSNSKSLFPLIILVFDDFSSSISNLDYHPPFNLKLSLDTPFIEEEKIYFKNKFHSNYQGEFVASKTYFPVYAKTSKMINGNRRGNHVNFKKRLKGRNQKWK